MNGTEYAWRCKSYAQRDVGTDEMDKKNARLAREPGVFLREEWDL